MFMSAGCQDIVSIWKLYHGKAAATMRATAQNMQEIRDVAHLIQYDTTEHIGGFICESIQITSALLVLKFMCNQRLNNSH